MAKKTEEKPKKVKLPTAEKRMIQNEKKRIQNKVFKTQDLEPIYIETSAFYIFKKNIIIENNRRIGFNPKMIITNYIESIDIDYSEDYELAKKLIKL